MRNTFGLSGSRLMVAVAIVAILGAIALPAYSDYVTRGKLAEAYAVLGWQRVKMEQYYQDVRDYTNACQPNTVAPEADRNLLHVHLRQPQPDRLHDHGYRRAPRRV